MVGLCLVPLQLSSHPKEALGQTPKWPHPASPVPIPPPCIRIQPTLQGPVGSPPLPGRFPQFLQLDTISPLWESSRQGFLQRTLEWALGGLVLEMNFESDASLSLGTTSDDLGDTGPQHSTSLSPTCDSFLVGNTEQ